MRVAAHSCSTRPHVLDYSGPDSGRHLVQNCWRPCPGHTDRSPWGKPILGHPSGRHAVWQRQTSNLIPIRKARLCLSRSPMGSPLSCKIWDELSIIPDKSQELTHSFEAVWHWPRLDSLDLRRVVLQAMPTYNMSQKWHRLPKYRWHFVDHQSPLDARRLHYLPASISRVSSIRGRE